MNRPNEENGSETNKNNESNLKKIKKGRKQEREEGEIEDDEDDDEVNEYENYSDDEEAEKEAKEAEKQENLPEPEQDSYDDDDDEYELNNKRLRIDEGEDANNQETKNLENDTDFSSASSSVSAFSATSVKTEISVISSTSLPLSVSTQKTEEEVKTPKKSEKLKVPPLKIICANPNGLPYVKGTDEARGETGPTVTRSKTGSKPNRTESPVMTARTPGRRINIGRASPSVKNRPGSPSSDSSICPANGSEPNNLIRRKLRSHTRQLQNGDDSGVVNKSPSSSPVPNESEELYENKIDLKTESEIQSESSTQSAVTEPFMTHTHELIMGNSTANCIKKFYEIRNEVSRRRVAQMQSSSDIKLPKILQEFLLVKKNYLIKQNRDVRHSIPFIKPSSDMPDELKELYIKQEKERYKLRLRHKVEQDKLIILYEQEILRCFNKQTRNINQTVPLSFCTIIKDAEVYSLYKNEQALDLQRPQIDESPDRDDLVLNRLNEIKQKFLIFKNDMIKRQLNESDSLYAVQKMDFQSKVRDLSMSLDHLNVPIVSVNSKFELFDAATIFSSHLQQQRLIPSNGNHLVSMVSLM